jgi:RNA polymerase sigma factor (sigma-70 family)
MATILQQPSGGINEQVGREEREALGCTLMWRQWSKAMRRTFSTPEPSHLLPHRGFPAMLHVAMDELTLIQAARRGDVDSFNELVLALQRPAYNLAYRILGESHAAADATQEAFISAFRNLESYRGGSFRGWVMRIVTNACYDERRRTGRHPEASLEAMPDDGEAVPHFINPADDPEQAAQQAALNRAIQACLDDLNEEQRVVAVLCDVQGYDYAEAAEIARTPLGTVKSRLSRARHALRECLQGIGELLPAEFRRRHEA